MLNKVGRKRCPRKDIGFPVAATLGGARTPVRRNGTGPSRGKARGGYTSPIPAEIGWMRWVYLGPGPLVRPHRRKSFILSPFSKGPSVRGVVHAALKAPESPSTSTPSLPEIYLAASYHLILHGRHVRLVLPCVRLSRSRVGSTWWGLKKIFCERAGAEYFPVASKLQRSPGGPASAK